MNLLNMTNQQLFDKRIAAIKTAIDKYGIARVAHLTAPKCAIPQVWQTCILAALNFVHEHKKHNAYVDASQSPNTDEKILTLAAFFVRWKSRKFEEYRSSPGPNLRKWVDNIANCRYTDRKRFEISYSNASHSLGNALSANFLNLL